MQTHALSHDVCSERSPALYKAVQRAEQYRAIFDGNENAMLVYAPCSLKILAINDAAARMYGYSVADLDGITVTDLWMLGHGEEEVMAGEDAAFELCDIFVEGGADPIRRQQRKKDGTRIEVELRCDGIIFGGKLARLIHLSDVTRRVAAEREVARLSRAQRMLGACNEALIRATDEQQLLQGACQIAVDIGGYLLAWVGFAGQDSDQAIVPMASAGRGAQLVLMRRSSWSPGQPSGHSVAARAIRTGSHALVADVHDDPLYSDWQVFAEAVGHKGMVGLPLHHGREVFGALSLYAPEALNISEHELALLQGLASDLAFGIHNLRALQEQRMIQAAVLKVGAAVARHDGRAFFQELVKSVVEAVGAQAGLVARLLPNRSGMCNTLFAMLDGQPIEGFDFDIGNTVSADYLQNDTWLLDSDSMSKYPDSPMLARMGPRACAARRLDNFEGQPIGFLAVFFRQATQRAGFVDSMLRIFAARAASELERLQSDARIRSQASLLDKAQDAIMVRDLQHHVIAWNRGCTRIYGWSADEVIGKRIPALLHGDGADYLARHALLLSDGAWSGEVVNRRRDGTLVHVDVRWTLVRNELGEPESVLSINTDITRRKAAEEAVHKLAYFDALTGLPNRQRFNDLLRDARQTSARSGLAGALLFVNLDKFKLVNETLGHVKGDLLLKVAAVRISRSVPHGDAVARIGGDEFLVLLKATHAQVDAALAHAANVAQRILQAFATPIPLEDFEHLASACIGIAAFSGEEHEDGELLKQVDLALYEAKGVGRGVVRFYDPRLLLAVAERAALEAELRQALACNELELYYQPQIHRDGHLLGVEALLRWKHPRRGMVSPAMFVPIAEESGLILSIGQWVIETACAQLAHWQCRPDLSHLSLSVNVSASQFRHNDFVDQVLASVHAHGLHAHSLKLELTESLLVYDMDSIIEKMSVLKSHGLGLSLDDFGTGYSSLSYLKRMPLDQLKIDQAFVRDVMTDPNDKAIARTVIGLGHSLGLMIIAEGVEQAEQRDFLFDSGCDAYQGYLLSRPLAIEDLQAFMVSMGHCAHPLPQQPPAVQATQHPAARDDAATLLSIAEAIPAMIAVTSADERYRFVNRSFEQFLARPSTEVIGHTTRQVLGAIEYERSTPWIRRVQAGETVSFEKAYQDRKPPMHVAISFIPLRSPTGQYDGYVTVGQDVTHQREEAVRLLQLSERDPLTGLLNRRGFESYLERETAAGGAALLGLLYVDLDHFKAVNDRHGHPAGDQVLREFAQRLRHAVRPTDAVARLGGDEFAVVLPGIPSHQHCVSVADKILQAAQVAIAVDDLNLKIDASVGIAFDAGDAEGLPGLIKRADAMLYQAKAAGRGRWV